MSPLAGGPNRRSPIANRQSPFAFLPKPARRSPSALQRLPAPSSALLLLAACTEPVPVRVDLSLDAAPLPYVEVTALPFDAEALLDSLSAEAVVPRPAFSGLEAEMRAYRPAPPADLGATGRAWAATRDSASRLADSLRAVGAGTPGYEAAYRRFQGLYGRLTERAARRESALRDLTDEARSLAERAGAAADSLRRWETAALAAFDSLAGEALRTARSHPVTAVTDEHGAIELDLPPGEWWIRLTLRHPDNPFMEFAWSVPVLVRGWWRLRVPLFEQNAVLRWRH